MFKNFLNTKVYVSWVSGTPTGGVDQISSNENIVKTLEKIDYWWTKTGGDTTTGKGGFTKSYMKQNSAQIKLLGTQTTSSANTWNDVLFDSGLTYNSTTKELSAVVTQAEKLVKPGTTTGTFVDVTAGTTSKPVYFTGGVPVAVTSIDTSLLPVAGKNTPGIVQTTADIITSTEAAALSPVQLTATGQMYYQDTKNTAGTTNKASSKMYLVGATSQAANPQTYSNSGTYIGTDNHLYTESLRVATEKYVDDALDALPEPMVYKGTIGKTGGSGTTPTVPTTPGEGETWKIIEENKTIPATSSAVKDPTTGDYVSFTAKPGDTIIATNVAPDGQTPDIRWSLIPSGDEPTGTVTSVSVEGDGSIITTSGSPITSSGTITVSHATGSGYKHIPAGGSSGQFLAWSAAGTAKWVANPNTDTKVTQNNSTTNADYRVLLSYSASNTNETNVSYKSGNLTFNPSTNTLSTTKVSASYFYGDGYNITNINPAAIPYATDSTPGVVKVTNTTSGLVMDSTTGQLSTVVKSVTSSSTNGAIKVNGSDITVYTHPSNTAHTTQKLYAFSNDALGHVTAATEVTASDAIKIASNVIKHDVTVTSDTTSTVSPAAGGTFTVVDSVTRDNFGHITTLNTKTVTLPSSGVVNHSHTFDGWEFDIENAGTEFGTCSTAAGTVAKVVTITPGTFHLTTGAMVTVKFTTTNTAANPTLNVNSTGAKAIYYRGAAVSAGTLAANHVYTFVYDGTRYNLVGDLDSNSTYTNADLGQGWGTDARTSSVSLIPVTLSGYKLILGGIVSFKLKYDIPLGDASLNINSTGGSSGIPLYYRNAPISDSEVTIDGHTLKTFFADYVLTVIYDGSHYQIISVNPSTDTCDTLILNCVDDDVYPS